MLKSSLNLQLGQHLTMTPQLQQAIRLLQLSTIELQLEVQQALESNPMLELVEETPSDEARDAVTETETASEASENDTQIEDWEEDLEDESDDDLWDDDDDVEDDLDEDDDPDDDEDLL